VDYIPLGKDSVIILKKESVMAKPWLCQEISLPVANKVHSMRETAFPLPDLKN